MLVIDKTKVSNTNIDFLKQFEHEATCIMQPGEHYKLLTYLSHWFHNSIILDIGTCTGHSCLALANNPTNKVITYDINSFNDFRILMNSNITFVQENALFINSSEIRNADLILLDISPHDGLQEQLFYNKLVEKKYKGFLLCDDIFYSSGMREWWDSIDLPKYDLTEIGHSSGTGLVNFSNRQVNIL